MPAVRPRDLLPSGRHLKLENLDFYLVIDNVLDKKYVEYYEYDQVLNGVGEMSGRNITLGLIIKEKDKVIKEMAKIGW